MQNSNLFFLLIQISEAISSFMGTISHVASGTVEQAVPALASHTISAYSWDDEDEDEDEDDEDEDEEGMMDWPEDEDEDDDFEDEEEDDEF